MTLLEELGGRDAVELVVAAFYDRVMADARLQPFFRGVQMSRLMKHQVDFFCAALGGGDVYRGRDLRALHAHMQLTDEHFDAVASHLSAALAACGVGPAHVGRVLGLIAPLRRDLVTAKARRPSPLEEEFYRPVTPALPPPSPWRWAFVGLAVLIALLVGALAWRQAQDGRAALPSATRLG